MVAGTILTSPIRRKTALATPACVERSSITSCWPEPGPISNLTDSESKGRLAQGVALENSGIGISKPSRSPAWPHRTVFVVIIGLIKLKPNSIYLDLDLEIFSRKVSRHTFYYDFKNQYEKEVGPKKVRKNFWSWKVFGLRLDLSYLDLDLSYLDLDLSYLDLDLSYLDLDLSYLDLDLSYLDLDLSYMNMDLDLSYMNMDLDLSYMNMDLDLSYMDLDLSYMDLERSCVKLNGVLILAS
jgi:hypothetical protein